jgi:hypothetical protein
MVDATRAEETATPTAVSVAGLLVVVPAFVLLAFGFGGPGQTVDAIGAVTTYALPMIAMIAFWWQDWPGTRFRPGWSGLTDTAIILVVGFGLAWIGDMVVTADDTVPLGISVFVVILQLTLVSDGWPLRGRGVHWPGLVALVASWIVGAGLYLGAIAVGMSHGFFTSLLAAIGMWQVVFFVALRGWPFSGIARRGPRLLAGNLGVIAAGLLTHVVLLDVVGWEFGRVGAVGSCGIAAVLVVAMLFQPFGRVLTFTTFVIGTIMLYLGLSTVAHQLTEPDHWVAYAAANALGIAVIMHVAVWRRWPVGGRK